MLRCRWAESRHPHDGLPAAFDVGSFSARSAGLRRAPLFRRRGLGEEVGSGSLRLRRRVLAEQEVDGPFPSSCEQRSLMGRLIKPPPSDNGEMGCKPHSEGRQAKEPYERPEQHSCNTADGNERHRRGDHQSPSEEEGVERRSAITVGGGGGQPNIRREFAGEASRHESIVSQTRGKWSSRSAGNGLAVWLGPIAPPEQERGPA